MNVRVSGIETVGTWRSFAASGLHLRVFTAIEDVEAVWALLQATGVSSVYQSLEWCKAWQARIGQNTGVVPCLVTAEDGLGNPAFLLPLQFRTRFGLRIVEFFATPQAAYGYGLYSQQFLQDGATRWFEHHMADVIALLPRHDVLHLQNLPRMLHGFANPLLGARSFLAANVAHLVHLKPEFDQFIGGKRSAESLRSMRKRDAKLAALGTLRFDVPQSAAEIQSTISTMFAQQATRLGKLGINNVFSVDEQAFINDLAQLRSNGRPLLRPYRLRLDDKILAVMLGAHQSSTYWALVSSLAEGEEMRFSPGDFALRALLKDLCEDGTRCLDFSAGDASYKHHWSDAEVSLHVMVRANSLGGLLFAAYLLTREKIKRLVKRTPILNTSLMAMRRKLAGRG
jgi:CelD/BcsL family acetyltransferase involved in cellulose biosynthesis